MPRGDKEEEIRAARIRAIVSSPATEQQLNADEVLHSTLGSIEEVGGTCVALGAVLTMSQKPAWSVAGLVLGTIGVALGHRDRQRSADIQAAQEMRLRRRSL